MASINTLMKKKERKKIYIKNGFALFKAIADFWPNINFAAIFWTLPDNKSC